MADHRGLDNNAGLDGAIEAHEREMLAAPAIMGLGENAAHRPYFSVEMAAQRGFDQCGAGAGAIFDDLRGRFAACGLRACLGAASRERRADK